ncbi:MAG: four-carbon acid sugar kinase family protein [Beijerinckiaceae bacterium]|nr:four-carbon acid sugar kinase family protein [Beijerinckiaceae bacterium]
MAPVITFYGDDFTGSSAVMEVLAFAGLPSIMFLDSPSEAMLARIDGMAAVGIAGISRSKPPEWMDAELPRMFAALKRLGAPILHYKTCSTFDSAPHLGSIGRAIELGLVETGASFVPLVVGAPAIGRYQVFGNLFAALDGIGYRLDRHPVMARHPATPMHEADLCRHLEPQTRLPSAVVDWRALLAGQGAEALRAARRQGARIIALDLFDQPTLEQVGEILWEEARQDPVYAVGSQGIEYALVAHFRRIGRLPEAPPPVGFGPAEPLLVVSGSCSETTARQIAAAGGAGFRLLLLDASLAVDPEAWTAELARIERAMLETLGTGTSLVVATARGPADPAIARFRERLESSGVAPGPVHDGIGQGLGRLVRAARLKAGLRRAIFAGGDTSGHAMLALGAEALEPLAPLAAGAPLLRVRSMDPAIEGLEVALKGGQMGDEPVFVRAARGVVLA